jgi:hypothetical protein
MVRGWDIGAIILRMSLPEYTPSEPILSNNIGHGTVERSGEEMWNAHISSSKQA